MALARRTALVVNALGPPTPDMIDRAKAGGRLVGALAGAAQNAERIVDAVGDVPVLELVASGAGGRRPPGVWCGSVCLTTEEAATHPVVKAKFLAATSADTVRSRSRTGKPARQLRSAWTDESDDPGTPMPLDMPLQPVLVDAALQRIDRAAHRQGSGAERLAKYHVGQIVGAMSQSKPAAQVAYGMIDEFIEATQSLGRQLDT